jgi:O-acetyl-ADP-ribose deacetylase
MKIILREKMLSQKGKFEIAQGDLTTEPVDAIVNAANAQLQHGGGVAWAIVRRGGEVIQRESDAWVHKYGPVSHDKAAFTTAGNLPCRYVIHVVGPVWGDTPAGASGDEDNKLAQAVRAALLCADELGLESLALPAISTGIFGFPKERAAGIIFAEIEKYFDENAASGLKLVRITLFDQPTIEAFLKVWDME